MLFIIINVAFYAALGAVYEHELTASAPSELEIPIIYIHLKK